MGADVLIKRNNMPTISAFRGIRVYINYYGSCASSLSGRIWERGHMNTPKEVQTYFANVRRKLVKITANDDYSLTLEFDNGDADFACFCCNELEETRYRWKNRTCLFHSFNSNFLKNLFLQKYTPIFAVA